MFEEKCLDPLAGLRYIYTSLFAKMVASKEKNACIQKYTITKNGSRNEEK